MISFVDAKRGLTCATLHNVNVIFQWFMNLNFSHRRWFAWLGEDVVHLHWNGGLREWSVKGWKLMDEAHRSWPSRHWCRRPSNSLMPTAPSLSQSWVNTSWCAPDRIFWTLPTWGFFGAWKRDDVRPKHTHAHTYYPHCSWRALNVCTCHLNGRGTPSFTMISSNCLRTGLSCFRRKNASSFSGTSWIARDICERTDYTPSWQASIQRLRHLENPQVCGSMLHRGNDGVLGCTSLRRFTLPSRKLDMKAGNESSLSLLMLNALNQRQSFTRRSSDDGRAHVHLLGVRVLLPGSRNSCINKAHFVVTLRLASHSIA